MALIRLPLGWGESSHLKMLMILNTLVIVAFNFLGHNSFSIHQVLGEDYLCYCNVDSFFNILSDNDCFECERPSVCCVDVYLQSR